MPGNFLTADTSFPQFREGQSSEEKLTQVTNYLFMLLEQLRYTLSNLGEDNFNETELVNIGNVITEPVYTMLKGQEGEIASLQMTAQGLSGRVSDAEGSVSALTQTVNGLSSRVSDAEGNVSSLTQTVNGLSLSVTNGASSSTIKLLVDGVAVSSKTIRFTGDVVFADNLTDGTTVISGDNIQTGQIKVGGTEYGSISVLDEDDIQRMYIGETGINFYGGSRGTTLVGRLRTLYEDGEYKVYMYAKNIMKLISDGDMTLDAGVIDGNTIYIANGVGVTPQNVMIGNYESWAEGDEDEMPVIEIYGKVIINGLQY